MSIIDSLLKDDSDEFRKEIHSALYNKIKEKLQDKKTEMAMTLYDEEPCEECEEQQSQ
jgi:hypothetical protein